MSFCIKSSLLLPALALIGFQPSAQADVSPEQWLRLNQSIVSEHVLPGYQTLASSAARLALTTAALCQQTDKAHLEASREAFRQTLAAWQGIQHINFGPVELLMRNYSMQFWPDKKNLTSRQLEKLLTAKDPATLSQAYLQGASIAVKGLPAMERLLFADQSLMTIRQNPFNCQFAHAVSDYIRLQSHNTYTEWQSFQQEFSYLESEEGSYESAEEAGIDLLKAQVEPIEIIRDLKLLRPLGNKKARPRQLESWRSRQALTNLRTNIASLHHMYSGLKGYSFSQLLQDKGEKALAASIEQQFVTLKQQLSEIPGPLYEQIRDDQVRAQLLQVSSELKQLNSDLKQAVSNLGVQLGFNSRDGD
ncbi:imelysin family protein [Neptuniibacter halophilus]|uniref:imelysin family protein n=1 Tax=Neptuniibacter halophilus TaxID=651666 RepID=UPI0025743603|nr:imelysin family protein [Neptuniibacter halophilus]